MPTYEYACKVCGQHLEVVQSFKDSALTECPACGGTLRKVFGNIGIAFRGSGFYRTDSRSSGAKPAAKSVTKAHATNHFCILSLIPFWGIPYPPCFAV